MFVDVENISPKLFERGYKELKKAHTICKIDVFGKYLPISYNGYNQVKFTKCCFGKNSADTFMTTAIVKTIYEEPLIDIIVIVTQDKDFAPAIKAVTDNKKKCILITEKNRIINNINAVGVNMKYFENLAIDLEAKQHVIAQISKKAKNKLSVYDLSHTCFIVNGIGEFTEIPFFSGIDYNDFMLIVEPYIKRIRRGYSNAAKIKDILEQNYLKLENDRVYYDVFREGD